MLHDDDGEVERADQHGGIAHAKNGRRIEEDDVEAVFHLRDEIHHALRIEHTDRIGGQTAAGEHEQIRL